MKIRTQNIIITRADGGAETLANTHLYAEAGCYLRHVVTGEAVSWHVQLGTADSAANYEDYAVPGEGAHDVPDALPDLVYAEAESGEAEGAEALEA